MPGHIDKTQAQYLPIWGRQIHMGKAKINRDAAPLFFLEPVGIDTSQRLYQRSFSVVDVARRTYND
jgi:hypothetical protein